MPSVPEIRLRLCNAEPVNSEGEFILYWMIATRRPQWNFGLQRAVEYAMELRRPLVVFEPLRCGYRWASDRLHAFALQGMADNAAYFADRGVPYYPYVEPSAGADKGLLHALAARACVVVTDEFPGFFLPHMVEAAAARLPVRLEQVDSNGLLPLRGTTRVFATARSFRAFLQKNLPPHLEQQPAPDPLARLRQHSSDAILDPLERRWPSAKPALLRAEARTLAQLPIDHTVPPAPLPGGFVAGRKLLTRFIRHRLARYAEHNEPEADAASGLSPYLHWGHCSAHAVFQAVASRERWSIEKLAKPKGGHREGWWNMSPEAEAFLDQLVTWRELGFNLATKRDDYMRFDTLPGWALQTLRRHERDPRPRLYSLDELEHARTEDQLWNAAQRQLVSEGRIQNYLRMLWGKRVLEWTRTPQEAYEILEHLNNKYALDGRDPNSYSGILWVFGRYDRPWGPERPIFGKVRYMSSTNTARKYQVASYLQKYGPSGRAT